MDTTIDGLTIKDYGRQVPLNEQAARAKLEAQYGIMNVYSTDEVRELFTVEGFSAPFVVVTRKSDGVRGSLEFTHSPRLYFNFVPK